MDEDLVTLTEKEILNSSCPWCKSPLKKANVPKLKDPINLPSNQRIEFLYECNVCDNYLIARDTMGTLYFEDGYLPITSS